MTLTNFIIITCSVLLNAVAQLFLKNGSQALNLNSSPFNILMSLIVDLSIWGGFLCYALSIGIWIIALSRVEVSTAYPLISMGFIFNVVAAWYLFGEAITAPKIAGILFITLGVLIIAKS